jgi:hypothetical protein
VRPVLTWGIPVGWIPEKIMRGREIFGSEIFEICNCLHEYNGRFAGAFAQDWM